MSKQTFRESQRVKPITHDGIVKCRDILKNGYSKVNEVMVDAFTAGAITSVYDALSDANKEKLVALPVARVADICFKLINKAA